MLITTGTFSDRKSHHKGYFRVFRFGTRAIELWAGTRYMIVSR